jgi:hypothetical protein
VLRHAGRVPTARQEVIKKNEFTGQESDDQLVENIEQINAAALGEGAVVCQACGSELPEGAPVVVYAFQPINEPTFQIGYTKWADGRYTPSE